MGLSVLFVFIFSILFVIIFILFIIWSFLNKDIFRKLLKRIWLIILSLIILFWLFYLCNSKVKLKENDIYGNYIIDKSMFKGKQTDWQYEHFKFTITKRNKMDFHIMENGKIVKTITGGIELKENYSSPRLVLKFEKPKFHILEQNPTLYRSSWSYYYVFESTKYGNMFFKKSNWLENLN